jgi:hypothetical protein
MARFKEYPDQTAASDVAKAVDIVLGLPRKGTPVGRGPHAHIPSTYSPGANGWTGSACEVIRDTVSGNALVAMIDSAASISTRNVDIGGKIVNINFTAGVVTSKPARYAPKQTAR